MCLNMGKEIFNKISSIQADPSLSGSFEYGNAPVNLGKAHDKSFMKLKTFASKMQEAGAFSEPIDVLENGIYHGSEPAFVEMFLNGEQFFVHMRALQLSGDKALGTRNVDTERILKSVQEGSVSIFTGMCLFGARTAIAITDKGQRLSLTFPDDIYRVSRYKNGVVKELSIDENLHPYEVDTILRSTSFINNLNSSAPVFLQLPRVEYYTYALDMAERGMMEKEQVLEWIRAVDKRTDGIKNLLSRRFKGRNPEIMAPLSLAEEYLKTTLRVDINVVIALLSSDPLWKEMLSANPPENLDDIRNLNYLYSYFSLAKKGLVIAVENPEEKPIMIHAENNAGLLGSGTIITLYPHPRVALKDQEGTDKKHMYFFSDDSQGRVRALVEIMRENRKHENNSK